METITKEKKKVKKEVVPTGPFKLVLHNDDFNTLEWVMGCLQDICGHSPEQAEQCTMIVHQRGHCDIKVGGQDALNKMKVDLLLRHLDATIEKNY
jgi:ATP-dependent Clp protease adaptor protein ClpS